MRNPCSVSIPESALFREEFRLRAPADPMPGALALSPAAESAIRSLRRCRFLVNGVILSPHPERRFVRTLRRPDGTDHATSAESCNCFAGLLRPDALCIHRRAVLSFGGVEAFYQAFGAALDNPALITCRCCGALLDAHEAPLDPPVCHPCALQNQEERQP